MSSFFFQAEDGIRDIGVTGVQTCALPISRAIQQRYGSVEAQLGYLAEKKLITPLTTQGNITDLKTRRIVYDARTGEGGSGAPLFGPSGRVIGITFAIFTENPASNFAVPIRYAVALLEK